MAARGMGTICAIGLLAGGAVQPVRDACAIGFVSPPCREGQSRQPAARHWGWTGRRCATGPVATMPWVLAGFLTDRTAAARRSRRWPRCRLATWPSGVRVGPDLVTVGVVRWRVVDVTLKNRARVQRRAARAQRRQALRRLRCVACQCARAIRVSIRRPSWCSSTKLCRSGRRRHSARSSRRADRTLAAGRSACRPARPPTFVWARRACVWSRR